MNTLPGDLAAGMQSCLAASETVTWRDVPGEIVLFDSRTGAYHALNPSAAEIWRRLSAGQSVGATIDDLVERVGEERTRIESDVIAFIRRALDEGFLLPVAAR